MQLMYSKFHGNNLRKNKIQYDSGNSTVIILC